jgi:hypothetical protein
VLTELHGKDIVENAQREAFCKVEDADPEHLGAEQ